MTTYNTPYGPIFYDTTGNDHRPNIVDYHPHFPKRHEAVKLQKPAFEAFQEAEKRYGKKLHPKHPVPSLAIPVSGSWRSFEYQRQLYASDSHRYASPYTSGHVQGIAIDVDTGAAGFATFIHNILTNLGWKQARPDEPWHYTFGVSV